MTKHRSFTGTEARRLLRRARTGTLATLNREDGIPYASLANVATSVAGYPLILVSTLAWHTRNLLADGRASLMVAETPAEGDALTGARVTVMGRFVQDGSPEARRRYLACHPEAAMYAGFGDFAIWRLDVERAHAVAGFGRIETLEANEVFPSDLELRALEASAIDHMNGDHSDTVQLYAAAVLGSPQNGWTAAGVDTDGIILTKDGRSLRLDFDTAVDNGEALRAALAEMARRLRKR